MQKISLPHPELIMPLFSMMEDPEPVFSVVGGEEVNYKTYVWHGDEKDDPIGLYDEDGNIYVSNSLKDEHPLYADLVAYHEQSEIALKQQGAEHDEAHKQAYVRELQKVKFSFDEPQDVEKYIHWRLSLYSNEKIPNKTDLAQTLLTCLSEDPLDQEKLLKLVTNSNI